MAEEEVEFVRGLVGGLVGIDWVPIFADEAQRHAFAAAFEPMLDPECEFFASTGGMAALDGEYKGREAAIDAYMALWSEWLNTWETYVGELEEIRELPDGRILVLLRNRSRSKAAGIEIEGEHGLIYTVRDSRVLRLEQYLDRNEALEAAGLRE